jgi:hypothetical protein
VFYGSINVPARFSLHRGVVIQATITFFIGIYESLEITYSKISIQFSIRSSFFQRLKYFSKDSISSFLSLLLYYFPSIQFKLQNYLF